MLCPFCKKVGYEYTYIPGEDSKIKSTTEVFCECKQYECPAYGRENNLPICKLVKGATKLV